MLFIMLFGVLVQATGLTAQSYRKVVTTARRDKKAGAGPRGLTEEQKQEIRCGRAQCAHM